MPCFMVSSRFCKTGLIKSLQKHFLLFFLTVKKNLPSTCLCLENNRLDSILIIKTNLNILRSTLENCEEVIISNAIKKYYEIKHWRWERRHINQAVTSSTKKYAKAAFGLHHQKILFGRLGSNTG